MNEFGITLVLISAIAVFLCCLILVFHPEYDDGLMGRLGMAMITFVAAARVLKLLDDAPDYLSPNIILIWIGLALFFSRHAYRFLRRASWKGPTWYKRDHSGKSFAGFKNAKNDS